MQKDIQLKRLAVGLALLLALSAPCMAGGNQINHNIVQSHRGDFVSSTEDVPVSILESKSSGVSQYAEIKSEIKGNNNQVNLEIIQMTEFNIIESAGLVHQEAAIQLFISGDRNKVTQNLNQIAEENKVSGGSSIAQVLYTMQELEGSDNEVSLKIDQTASKNVILGSSRLGQQATTIAKILGDHNEMEQAVDQVAEENILDRDVEKEGSTLQQYAIVSILASGVLDKSEQHINQETSDNIMISGSISQVIVEDLQLL